MQLHGADRPDRRARQAAGEDILRNRLVRELAQFLVNHDDPGIQRVAGPVGSECFAPQLDRSFIRLIDACQDLHQRRFAGTVLTDDAEHLALIQREDTSLRTDTPRNALETRSISRRCGNASPQAFPIALAISLWSPDRPKGRRS